MYPANNPNHTFPWGIPQPIRNQNPFRPPSLFTINFVEDTPPASTSNSFQQQGTNTWYPSPWNSSSYPPQPRSNHWNQWGASPRPLASLPRPHGPQMPCDLREILSKKRQQCPDVKKPVNKSVTTCQKSQPRPQDLREILSKKRQQCPDVKKPVKNCVTTSQKSQPMPQVQVPTTTLSQTSQSKQQPPTDTTIKVSELRNCKDFDSLGIPTVHKYARPHFLAFKEMLKKFLVHPKPSLFFGGLVKELIMCSKMTDYISQIQKFIHANLDDKRNPCLAIKALSVLHARIRMFWLLGEIYRPEYDACFQTVRKLFKADELFQDFLRKYTVETPSYIKELQALWCYWKKFVPKNVMDGICLHFNKKNIMNSVHYQSTMELESVYVKFFGYSELAPQNDGRPPQKSTPIFDVNYNSRSLRNSQEKINANLIKLGQNRNITAQMEGNQFVNHNYNWPAKAAHFSLPSATTITHAKPTPVSHVKPQEAINFKIKIAKLLSLLDNLVTVDRSDVPKAASELMFCFLEHGSDHQLSDRISKETTKRLQEICNNSKIIRVLWVIGYLFFPKYESKLTAFKPTLEKIAARLFWICLSKTHRDASTRDEMRVIFKLWREIVPEEIISSITIRIKDAPASDPEANMNWILNDKNIRKGTRIVDFYTDNYLKNASTAGPKSKVVKNQAKEKNITSDEDSDNEVIILDKCDVIKPTKHNSEESLDARHKPKKRTKVTEGETDKIFTTFHRIPSKPVNLVKPVLRKEPIIDESSNVNSTKPGNVFNCGSSGSGNQEHQQSGGLSKLELFRKKMEKDQAISSIGGGHRWNGWSLRDNKEIYLRQDWTVDEFVYCVCSEEFQTSWDIVNLNGNLRVKIMRK